jgi:hypothetical protein
MLLLFTLFCWIDQLEAASGCPPGQVRDLDGTCVKKVLFPPRERASCAEPQIPNGYHFFGADGRSVNFYCETDHVLVPENALLICRITGRWSKQIPVCLKPGCQAPVSPEHGWLDLDYNDTLAVFNCDTGYQLEGSRHLGCENGRTWNSSYPTCNKIMLPTTPSTVLVRSSDAATSAASILTLSVIPTQFLLRNAVAAHR